MTFSCTYIAHFDRVHPILLPSLPPHLSILFLFPASSPSTFMLVFILFCSDDPVCFIEVWRFLECGEGLFAEVWTLLSGCITGGSGTGTAFWHPELCMLKRGKKQQTL